MHSKISYAILRKLCFNDVIEKTKIIAVSNGEVFFVYGFAVLRDGGMEVLNMREGIHPNYYQAKVVCNCGNEFVTGSTKEEIHVEICSKCHSFYTGQQKAVKARGAIDKFNRKYGIQAN